MLIFVNNDEEEASALAALEVIKALRAERVWAPDTEDNAWVRTAWPKPEYL
jgi:hypothetical protein